MPRNISSEAVPSWKAALGSARASAPALGSYVMAPARGSG